MLYHRVFAHEGFAKAAQDLFELVRDAQKNFPGTRRMLFMDIEGHRNSVGGYDNDMVELMKKFALEFLGRFVSEIKTPLFHVGNPNPQENDLPDMIKFTSDGAPE